MASLLLLQICLQLISLIVTLCTSSNSLWAAIAILCQPLLIENPIADAKQPWVSPQGNHWLLTADNANSSYETELLKLTNFERQKVGLPALQLSPQLIEAAQIHIQRHGQ